MTHFTQFDVIAGLWFLFAWGGLSWLTDRTSLFKGSLTQLMDEQRRRWMLSMLQRDVRITDTAILAGLQNGTAFFASTSLIALGGTLTLLNQSERMLAIFADLPFHVETDRQNLEVKVIGLAALFGYAFFKFGWSYRLFNYAAILIGAVPPQPISDQAEAARAANRASIMQIAAGHHFHWGLRALFFSIGYLGWFAGPLPFMITTTLIVAVLTHRQYWSSARASLHD